MAQPNMQQTDSFDHARSVTPLSTPAEGDDGPTSQADSHRQLVRVAEPQSRTAGPAVLEKSHGVEDAAPAGVAAEAAGKEAAAPAGGGEGGDDDESKYPGGFALTVLTVGLCFATFVVALDNTIIGGFRPVRPAGRADRRGQRRRSPRSRRCSTASTTWAGTARRTC